MRSGPTAESRGSISESHTAAPVCIVVRPGRRTGDLARALRSLRRLLPHALLLAAPGTPSGGVVVLVLDADDIVAGPLSAAAALQNALQIGGAPGGTPQ